MWYFLPVHVISIHFLGADQIIRQHKSACLRITSLLICKDLLWIGTSAGVVLTNPLPSITASTSVLRSGATATGLPHGHTGHVRFLTCVEVPRALYTPPDTCDNATTTTTLNHNHHHSSSSSINSPKRGPKDLNHKSTSSTSSTLRGNSTSSLSNTHSNNGCHGDTVTLVVSGGDGYEDFRYNQQTEAVGRDDSTNHLLVWKL